MATRKQISTRTRFEVLKRDKFCCQYCGAKAPEAILHIDHIIPIANGGGNELLNLVTSCADCNLGKSDKELSDDSIVLKQIKQAEDTEEVLQQKKLMAKWIKDLKKVNSHDLDFVKKYMSDSFSLSLSDYGEKIISKLIKKYGLKELIECIDISANNYLTDKRNEENRFEFFNKIGAICACREKDRKDPEGANLRRLTNFCTKKFGFFSHSIADDMKEANENGASFEEIERLLRSSRNITHFRKMMAGA